MGLASVTLDEKNLFCGVLALLHAEKQVQNVKESSKLCRKNFFIRKVFAIKNAFMPSQKAKELEKREKTLTKDWNNGIIK